MLKNNWLVVLVKMIVKVLVNIIYGENEIEVKVVRKYSDREMDYDYNGLDYWKWKCEEGGKWYREYRKLMNMKKEVIEYYDDDDIKVFMDRLEYVKGMVKLYGVVNIK